MNSLDIIKEALTQRPEPLAVVTSVSGGMVTLATAQGAVVINASGFAVGDKVQLHNGVATKISIAQIVEAI